MKISIALHGCLVLLLLAGCGKKPGAAAGAPGGMPPQEVGVVTLASERVDVVTELPGRTAAFRMAEVRPQVSGIILKRLFTEGSEVKEGQQLYQIDPATYQAALESAQAALARAEATQQVAKLLADRRQKLVNSRVISSQDYDDAHAGYQQAVADVAAARAALKAAQINLVYTKVLSPISGRIGRSMMTEGALVTSEQSTPLATVQQIDPIYVDVTQSSAQLLRLQRELAAGQLKNADEQEATARLILEDGTPYAEAGKLQFSEVSVDPGTGSVTLRAVFPNPDRILLPGMFVRAMITGGINENAILIPQKGVTRNPRGEPVAMVVGEGNRIEVRTLKTDRVINGKWLIVEGVKAGNRVVLEGLQKIGPGAEVRPVEITEGK